MHRFSFLAVLASAALTVSATTLAQAASAPRAAISPLATPAAMEASRAVGISSNGTVAGTLIPSLMSPTTDAAVWRNGVVSDLGRGDVLGISPNGTAVGYTGRPEQAEAATWNANGAVHHVGLLSGGTWSMATAGNAVGQVVGYADTASGTRAFIASATGRPKDLGTRGGGPSYAYGINDGGLAVGSADGRAVEWDAAGRLLDLGAGASSTAYGVNNGGDVVGDANGRAFLWSRARGIQRLQQPSSYTTSHALAIGATGLVVGSAEYTPQGGLPETHAVLWSNRRLCDLNTLLPANSGWELETATGINAGGVLKDLKPRGV